MSQALTGEWHIDLSNIFGDKVTSLDSAHDRKITFALNKPGTIEFYLDPYTPAALRLFQGNSYGIVQAYKNGVLVLQCEITSTQLSGAGTDRKIAVVATELPFVRLSKRYLAKSVQGAQFTGTDRGLAVAFFLAILNAEVGTGIDTGTINTTSNADSGPWYYKKMTDFITEMSEPLNGFDYWFDHFEPSGNAATLQAELNIDSLRGSELTDFAFRYGEEYGTSANLMSYDWMVDQTNRITRCYSLPPTYPNNQGLGVQGYGDSTYELAVGRREDVLQDDLIDPYLRQFLVQEHVGVRKNVRNIYKFNPQVNDGTGRVPSFLEDYNIGDRVEARVNDLGYVTLDGIVRIHGASVTLDDNGAEHVELVTEEQEA